MLLCKCWRHPIAAPPWVPWSLVSEAVACAIAIVQIGPRNHLTWFSLDPSVNMYGWLHASGITSPAISAFGRRFRGELFSKSVESCLSGNITYSVCYTIICGEDEGYGAAV